MASTRSTSKAGTATTEPTATNRLAAEFLGTFVLVLGGCGSAVLAAVFLNDDDLQLGIGFVGVALAFGLTVTTMAYAVGHVSGGHFNPAVTLGLAASRRFACRGSSGSRRASRASPPTGTATAPPAATTCSRAWSPRS